jgi:hypothetical protein
LYLGIISASYLTKNATIATIMTISINSPVAIINGENTHHHDQSIRRRALSTTKVQVSIDTREIPPVELELETYLLFMLSS